MAAARQRANDDPFVRVQVRQDGTGDVTQPPGYSMPLHRGANRLSDNQTDPWSAVHITTCVHDDVRLRRSYPVLDRGAELRRPRHPVLGRQHAA